MAANTDDRRPGAQPLPPLAFSELAFATSHLDRKAELRSDPSALKALRDLPHARWLIFQNDEILIDKTSGRWHLLFDESAVERLAAHPSPDIYLGDCDGHPVFAIAVQNLQIEDDVDLELFNLRSLAELQRVAPHDLGLAATARALMAWHARHGFCAACGGETQMADAGWRRKCSSCDASHFPRTDPVVIMAVYDGDRCLLGRSPHFKPGMYSCLAGFMEPGETIEAAVRREVWEEAGIKVRDITYQFSQPWPFPMSLMIGCLARAETREISLLDSELEDARWFEKEEVISMISSENADFSVPPTLAIARHLVELLISNK